MNNMQRDEVGFWLLMGVEVLSAPNMNSLILFGDGTQIENAWLLLIIDKHLIISDRVTKL